MTDPLADEDLRSDPAMTVAQRVSALTDRAASRGAESPDADEDPAPVAEREMTLDVAPESVISEDQSSLEVSEPDHAPAIISQLDDLVPAMELIGRMFPLEESGRDAGPATKGQLRTGRLLGDFRIRRVLGRGGMGVVYEAVQVSLDRRVALKILPAGAADDPRRLRRFQIEAQATACLNHAHIVPVYLVGSEAGVNFFAMQLIQGSTLAEIVASLRRAAGLLPPDSQATDRFLGETAPTLVASMEIPAEGQDRESLLPPPVIREDEPESYSWVSQMTHIRVCELMRQAADGLHHAHQRGIVHRDIKPSNLMIDESGKLWITDFGLARIGQEADLTMTGTVLGTLRYMSPEQADGAGSVVDHRTDIYSLGVTMYELLTRRPAYTSNDRISLLREISEKPAITPRRIDPTIPRDLDTIVSTAMAKAPTCRYQTAAEMADDLDRFVQGLPIKARPPGYVQRTRALAFRHRMILGAAGLVLISFLVSLIGVLTWRQTLTENVNQELRDTLARAERGDRINRTLLYISQINLARQALDSEKAELAASILDGLKPVPGQPDVRGFEWFWLRRRCEETYSLLAHHDAAVAEVRCSPDGRYLASASERGELVLWDIPGAKVHSRFSAHSSRVNGIQFCRGGARLISWALRPDGVSEVRLWELGPNPRGLAEVLIPGELRDIRFLDGEETLAITSNKGGLATTGFWIVGDGPEAFRPFHDSRLLNVASIAVSEDGCQLATADTAGQILLRDPTTREVQKALSGRKQAIRRLAFSHDGTTLAVGHAAGITLWNVVSGRELATVSTTAIDDLVFSPEDIRLVGIDARHNGVVLIRSPSTYPETLSMEEYPGHIFSAEFSPRGHRFATVGQWHSVMLWDQSLGRRLATYSGLLSSTSGLAYSKDGRSLFFGGADGFVRRWRLSRSRDEMDRLSSHEGEVWSVAFDPTSSLLVSSSDDDTIKLWDALRGRELETIVGHESLVEQVAISPDGKTLASASFDHTVRLWDLATRRPIRVLRGHTDQVRTVVFSHDGRKLASAGADRLIRTWDLETYDCLEIAPGHERKIFCLATVPGGLLYSCSEDGTVRAYEWETGRPLLRRDLGRRIFALAASRDGRSLAAGDDGGGISILDSSTLATRTVHRQSDAQILGLAFDPSGRRLAAACVDGMVRLLDVDSGLLVLTLEGHSRQVNAVAFSPDGRSLASAGHDGAVLLRRAGELPTYEPSASVREWP